MDNLRLVSVNIIDSVTIEVTFTHNLSTSITKSNFQLLSEAIYTTDSLVTDVSITENVATLTCLPLAEYTPYKLVAKSDSVKFTSLNNDAILLEDNIANTYIVVGPTSPENPIRQFCESYLNGSLYDTKSDLINSYLNSTTDLLSRALYDIRQAKNENYLSKFISDEVKVRGKGPTDRLNEEGSYYVSRVAKTPTGTKSILTRDFTSFPSYPITFNETASSDVLTASNTFERSTFNINELVLSLKDDNVIKLNSLTFSLSSAPYVIDYPIDTFGYQILQNKYDPDHASKYYLESNQIKLSSNILDVTGFDINNILQISVNYSYSDLGININESTLALTTVLTKQREVIPTLFNKFSFGNVPIVDTNGNNVTFGGVVFYNPNGFNQHPAFINEIPYNVSNPPSLPGQFSIDYLTGECLVYGAEQSDGTGDQPPLATYNYKHTYQSNIDYQYDVLASKIEDKNDLIALPDGALVNEKATYSVEFEKVLIKDIDYKEKTHIEVLNEYVDNNLVALNAIKLKNAPITNVFRIYNETSGEVYQINRWYKDKVYFNYINAPKVNEVIFERVAFNKITNEELLINEILSVSGQNILKINLTNNKITSRTEDGIGSFTNSSVEFTSSIFVEEVNYISSLNNLSDGQYSIDYENGVIYFAITTYSNLGKVSYGTSDIKTLYPNIISAEDIYFKINPKDNKQKSFDIQSSDQYIVPASLNSVNERSYDDASYYISNKKIGYFNPSFINQVKYNIKDIRGIYELIDYNQNPLPINFASNSIFTSNQATVETKVVTELCTIKQDGYGKYIDSSFPIRIISSTLTYNVSAIGLSTSIDYFDYIEAAENTKIRLLNTAVVGDLVNLNIQITINDMSNIIIDYNKGDLYVDYTYLADTIIVSYEYGDNLIDFTSSNTVSENDTYYVSYYVGALRDALLTNFGQIINSPILNTFDTDLERERYRDAVIGALASFIKGPTIEAMKVLGFNISHIEPEVIESIFSNWILGSSYVTDRQLTAPANPIFEQAKYGNGLLLGEETIEIPASSYIRTEEGTLSFWIKNKWDGIDNDSELSVSILADTYPIPKQYIFIGADLQHPETDSSFVITKDITIGTPVKRLFGVYLYIDFDPSKQFYRWYLDIVNDYTSFPTSVWDVNISSDKIYDFKEVSNNATSKITTLTKSVKIKVTAATNSQSSYSFIAGYDKCLLSGDDRFNLIKDTSGYLNFFILDKFNNKYQIQSDVSSWKANDLHHLAMSWKLNNPNKQDEMHLFIDGKETSNIIKYGQQLSPYLHQKFQTVNQEQIIAFVDKDIVGSTDLQTIINTNTVTSSIAFSSYNISNGDILSIIDIGDFVISNVLGNSLQLTTNVPVTLTNAKFSVNKLSKTIASDWFINSRNIVLANTPIIVDTNLSCAGSNVVTTSTALDIVAGNLIKIDNSIYTVLSVNTVNLTINDTLTVFSNKDFCIYDVANRRELYGNKTLRKDYLISEVFNNEYSNTIDIYNNVLANDIVYIESLGLNNKLVSEKVYVWSDNHENILKTHLPTPINLDEVKITKHLIDILINSTNSTLVGNTFTYTGSIDQPSNSSSGRTLTVSIGHTNIDFSTPATVQIVGEVFGAIGLVTEIVTFTSTYTQDTIHKFTSVNSITAQLKVTNTNKGITFNIKEKYILTYDEGSSYNYVIRHSHQIQQGSNLDYTGVITTGNIWVEDTTVEFSDTVIGNVLIIQTTTNSGYYNILDISEDRHSLYIQPTQAIVASFTNAKYLVVKVNNTGFANGWMYLEQKEIPGNPAFLRRGTYEIKYHSYAAINVNFKNIILGNNVNKTNPANCVFDHIRSDFRMLSDVRSGEISLVDSITKEYNLISPSKANKYTLLLANLDEISIEDKSNFYPRFINEQLLKTSLKVNDNFDDSLVLDSSGIRVDNNGNLNNSEGTIEFWVNPLIDTDFSFTDNYYFDAYSAVVEEVETNSSNSIIMNGNVGQVLSVTSFNNEDYFGNGYVETLPTNSIKETVVSLNKNSVKVNSNILQIISIKAIDDLSGVNYGNGTIVNNIVYLEKSLPSNTTAVEVIYRPINTGVKATPQQIIKLGKRLPSQKQKVLVKYLPSGINGDRISIFTDKQGFINFKVVANSTVYNIKSQVFFERNTWHKIKASYKFNSSSDKMILFVDGYSVATYDSNSFDNTIVTPLYNTLYDGYVFGGTSYLNRNVSYNGYELSSSIKFKDPIHTITIGAEFDNTKIGNILLSNLRISNIYKELYKPYGEALDLSYNSNISAAYPVTEDLYTTYLLDLKENSEKTDDFAILKTKEGGMFDFTLNIFDSFGIVSSSKKVKDILETLVKSLKPANSRVKINYKS
jgi:hypothetical protein